MTHRIGLAAGLVLSLLCGGAHAADPPALSDVPEHVARDGVLSVTLEAKEGKTDFGGVSVDTIAYNGVFAGPVLRVWPGDTLRVLLRNRLNEPTNLHFHGMQTSPRGNSDNVHLAIQPGEDFGYEIKFWPSSHRVRIDTTPICTDCRNGRSGWG
jgi:FtsP/CotA-like multicopper oxidase with cupredoxin domain